MKLDFSSIKEQELVSFNGGEGTFLAKIQNDGLNKILLGRLKKDCSIGLHTHTDSSEIIYVISGEGLMVCDGEEEILRAGDAHYCRLGHNHTFKNVHDEECVFFAVVPKQGEING